MIEPATGTLRELQLVELEMLCDFRDICQKHNLQYFLDSGTLLGAVRHKGFIPWDDDIDIVMPYKDYVEFLSIAAQEFGNEYFLQTCDTDKNFHRSYARIRKNNTTFMDAYNLEWDIHHGIWIDIFPLVEINSGLEYKIKKLVMKLSNYMLMENFFQIHIDEFKELLGRFGAKAVVFFHKIPRKTRRTLMRWIMSPIFNAKKKKMRIYISTAFSKCFPPEIYASPTQLEFEGELFDVPILYEKYLEIAYGDYMQLPPEEQRKGHGGSPIIDFEKGCCKQTPTNC